MSSSTAEPRTIASGETITWVKTLFEYAAPGHSLGYKIVGQGGMVAASVVSALSEHAVTLTATALSVGYYTLVGYVTDGLGVKTKIYEDEIEVTVNLIGATGAVDTRSYWRKLLEATEAVLLNRASVIQKSMTVPGAGSRSIEYLTHKELYEIIKICEFKIQQIDGAARIAQGKTRRKILIQFT